MKKSRKIPKAKKGKVSRKPKVRVDKIALKKKIRDIPDFPKKGIIFRDITTLLKDKEALCLCIDAIADYYEEQEIDYIAAAESRGFILGPLIAERLDCGFIPIRKPGKLPAETIKHSYELEYGTDALEIHKDALERGHRVLIVDDLLATGGTSLASVKLIEKLEAEVVGLAFLIELGFLRGREKLNDYEIFSLLNYNSEE